MNTPELVTNWRQAYKMSSVQVGGFLALLAAADQWLPGLMPFLPPGVYAILGAAVVVARLIAQPKLPTGPPRND